MYHLSQIALNQKLLCAVEKWCEFYKLRYSEIGQKSKRVQQDLPVFEVMGLFLIFILCSR